MRLLGLLMCTALLAVACRGADNAARGDVESLRPKAAAVTDLLVKNDWKAVRKDFDTPMTFERGDMKSRVIGSSRGHGPDASSERSRGASRATRL